MDHQSKMINLVVLLILKINRCSHILVIIRILEPHPVIRLTLAMIVGINKNKLI